MPTLQIPLNLETRNFRVEKCDFYGLYDENQSDKKHFPHKIVYGDYYFLDDELSNWMIENNISYKIEFYGFHEFDKPWFVVIDDPEKAMLYKLTWC